MRRLALLGVVALFAAAPAAAEASTAAVNAGTLEVSGTGTEANTLVVAPSGLDLSVTETGTGATLSPGAGCSAGGTGEVICSAALVTSVKVAAGDGNDRVTSTVALPATLQGGNGNDVLIGGPAGDSLEGGAGWDVLDGGTGNDVLAGGADADTATWATRSTPVVADIDGVADDGETSLAEADNVQGDVEILTGGSADDTLTGGTAGNGLDGGPGADTLAGGGGEDWVLYWTRSTSVDVTLDGVRNDGAAGENDLVASDIEGAAGGTGNDTLTGNGAANPLYGGAGNDHLDGGGGPDPLNGGDGTDHVSYASRTQAVSVDGDGVADDGEAGEGDNVGADVENLTGGAGPDTLTGTAAANVLSGGDGDDTLDGAAGADDLAGGAGTDTVTYLSRAAAVSVDLDDLADDGEASEGDNARSDLENVIGGTAGDTLTGNGEDNVLSGGDGDDTLTGEGGADALQGGPGTDTASYAGRTAALTVDLDGAADDGEAGEGDNAGSDVESVIGGDGPDTLTGNAGSGTLSGGAGADRLDGGGGADVLAGGPDRDLVTYATRSAAVSVDSDGVADDGEAGEGDDVSAEDITGGAGADTLTGDDGANTLRGGAGADTLAGAGGNDLIQSRDASRDDVACGAGGDEVVGDRADAIDTDCEQVDRGPRPSSPPKPKPEVEVDEEDKAGDEDADSAKKRAIAISRKPVTVRGNVAPVRVACPVTAAADCRGVVTIALTSGGKKAAASRRNRKRVLGRAGFTVPKGKTKTVKVKLSRNGRHRLRRKRRARCRVSVALRGPDGRRTVTTQDVTIKTRAPRPSRGRGPKG